MRLVFLTNFYPPGTCGGHEQWCSEVAGGLRQRGHDLLVLTSRCGRSADADRDPDWVRRNLHLEMSPAPVVNAVRFLFAQKALEATDRRWLRKVAREFAADLFVVWGMWNLPRSLAREAEELMGGRVAYYVADYWPALPRQHEAYWEARGRSPASELVKHALAPLARSLSAREKDCPLAFSHAMFPTAFVRDELTRRGVCFERTKVIAGGVDTERFATAARGRSWTGRLRPSLLYAGRLVPEKGVETAIAAMKCLRDERGVRDARLVVAGSGPDDYVRRLREMTRQGGLDDVVRFAGMVEPSGMPALYASADIVLFTSVWPEPFGRVPVEAMASGAVVVGTATGGAAEVLRDGENGLVFPANDEKALAARIERLISEPDLGRRLAQTGFRDAREKWDLGRMVAEIETYLQSVMDE